jgi:hypothetical protein
MFSIKGYVPFCDVADLCLRAAEEASKHEVGRLLPLFSDWANVDLEDQRKALRALGFLMADLTVQSGAEFVICSPKGVILTPSQTLLSLDHHTASLSLDDPLDAFLRYTDGAYWRYRYLDTQTWCVRHRSIDPDDVDVDDETGEVLVDPMDVVVDNFHGWALAVASDSANKTTAALLSARLAKDSARATVLPMGVPVGRPNKINNALLIYDRHYPDGHAAAGVPIKTVLAKLKAEGHPISAATLHRGLSPRKSNT